MASAYNFGTTAYYACFGDLPECDTQDLRKRTIDYLSNFDKQSWYSHPCITTLHGSTISDGTLVDSIDAFKRVNGKQIEADAHVVDQVIAHILNYEVPKKDLRTEMRGIDWKFFTSYAHIIAGNQAMDFWKQDGITEIEEAIQANCIEQRENDFLLQDEKDGKVVIRRHPIIVGTVCNFSNFLDLSRKTLRHLEVGVPVVIFGRANTSQHMYRWTKMLIDFCRELNVDAGMVTYLCASVSEYGRVMNECRMSPMHLTGSRPTSAAIKKVCPRLISSTGGPNTIVATEYNEAVGNAVRISNLIENKGQCTALRHFVCPGVTPETMEKMYASSKNVKDPLEALELNECAGALDIPENTYALQPGYSKMKVNGRVHYKIDDKLPAPGINERWRELYIDVTSPPTNALSDPKFLADLAKWLNTEQPISCAINSNDYSLADKIFETTGLVVYTVGSLQAPALTAQARPQDGEVFGEIPPRHLMKDLTYLPMLNPVPCPAWQTVYSDAFLEEKGTSSVSVGRAGKTMKLTDDVVAILNMISRKRLRGYANILLEYVVDCCQSGPRVGKTGNRTSLFGLQRTPLDGSVTMFRCENRANLDYLLLHAVLFAATNAKDGLEISTGFEVPEVLSSVFAVTNNESHTAYEERKQGRHLYNEICIDAPVEYWMAFQFCARVFPFGHIKSTTKGDQKFLDHFTGSRKWLRLRQMARPTSSL